MCRGGPGRLLVAALTAWLCLWPLPPAGGCTLFGAAGPAVAGGGTLLVKNRDWRPDQSHVLALVTPTAGYRFLGLFARGGNAPGLKAGVNQAGLAVVSATAGSRPRAERRHGLGLGGRLRALLAGCDSVESALRQPDLWRRSKPVMLLLADSRELARVEIAPNGRLGVTRQDRGSLWQTNHYLEPALADANTAVGRSSAARAARIQALLAAGPRPLTLPALLAMSRDTTDGPDNGIWRTGSRPGAVRTVATFAVALPPRGPGRLEVRLVDPGRPEQRLRLPLDARTFGLSADQAAATEQTTDDGRRAATFDLPSGAKAGPARRRGL